MKGADWLLEKAWKRSGCDFHAVGMEHISALLDEYKKPKEPEQRFYSWADYEKDCINYDELEDAIEHALIELEKNYTCKDISYIDHAYFYLWVALATFNERRTKQAGKDSEETMGVEAAAKFLQITKWRVYQLTQKNKIPFHRATGHAGRKLVFIKSELEEVIWDKRNKRATQGGE